MNKIYFADWQLTIEAKEGITAISVTHGDNSPVVDTESDIGDTDTLGYRLTSQKTEDDYKAQGDAGGVRSEEELEIGKYKITLVNDEDNHLGIYCKKTCGEPEHISLTNGTEHSKECEITIR
ncbi:conserved hypothetical protein [Vibrio chagasii]|nr:conserved hypothetical protein [Vibrio chagasii]